MQRAIKGREQLAFVGAASEFGASPNSQSVACIMSLAMEATCASVRQRASDWLFRVVGVKVVDEDGGSDAASATTEGLRR